MQITVQREVYTDESTQGEMLIDGEHFCWTLEPRKDQSLGKPYCIPAGTYTVVLQPSHRFEMTTPHLIDVPGFTEIELHPGNSPLDTEGCTLVGFDKEANYVGRSRAAFEELMTKILTACEITYLG